MIEISLNIANLSVHFFYLIINITAIVLQIESMINHAASFCWIHDNLAWFVRIVSSSWNRREIISKAALLQQMAWGPFQYKDHWRNKIDGLVQERRNSIANALELCLSCTK